MRIMDLAKTTEVGLSDVFALDSSLGTKGVEFLDMVKKINDNEASNKNISDAFDELNTYEVGDYCIYLNRLYRFIEKKENGPWDGTKVVPCTISQELNELSREMENMNSVEIFRDYRDCIDLADGLVVVDFVACKKNNIFLLSMIIEKTDGQPITEVRTRFGTLKEGFKPLVGINVIIGGQLNRNGVMNSAAAAIVQENGAIDVDRIYDVTAPVGIVFGLVFLVN